MSIQAWALLTLDLPGATSEQRAKFNAALAAEGWFKVPDVDTVWRTGFTQDGASGIIKATEVDIDKALKQAGHKRCVAILSISGATLHKPDYLPKYGPLDVVEKALYSSRAW